MVLVFTILCPVTMADIVVILTASAITIEFKKGNYFWQFQIQVIMLRFHCLKSQNAVQLSVSDTSLTWLGQSVRDV